jgi:alkanesulfonate monooxygenase SsuD/methylene tetrahydromethanopterin reductase-like flavin-dependent oxidoreductase (luciferase family)
LLPTKEYPNYSSVLEALSTLSYLAGKTERFLLGTGVIIFPMREAILFAKQAAAIQILSNNRLLLGLGAGWLEEEFKNVRASFSDRGQYYDEGIQLFRWLMHGNAEFSGEFYTIQDGTFDPVPKKEIPIYIGGNSGVSIRRAAKLGNGWFPIGIPPSQLKKGKEKLQTLTQKKMTLVLRLNVAFAEKRGALERESRSPSGEISTRLAGVPEEISEQISEYRRAGLNHLVCSFGDREPKILETKIKEFGETVLPLL